MDSWGTILLGYGITFGAIAAYAFSILSRSRAIGHELGIGVDDSSVRAHLAPSGDTAESDHPHGDGSSRQ